MSEASQPPREQWGSKLGVILAVAGSAVGLGNFLRFPGLAAKYGGGAFMIPYFIAFLLIGIPICWVEWTMGRHGGRYGFNSAAGIFSVLWRHPVSKYFGALALLIPVGVYTYYVYIESWCLGYAFMYLTGQMELGSNPAAYSKFFTEFTGQSAHGSVLTNGSSVFWFFIITFCVNFFFIYRGLSKGIETFCKYAMPVLIGAAIVVVLRVITLPEQPLPDPWQVTLPKALPVDEWRALVKLATDPATEPKAMREALAAALDRHFELVLKRDPRHTTDVLVTPPAGFENTDDGIRVAMAELRAGEKGREYRDWIRKTRETLDLDTKITLQRLERRELAGADAAGKEAIAKERAALLASMPILPGLADASLQYRMAALEASALPRTVNNGLGYMWNPDFSQLWNPAMWLDAAGQIFFSLSVGFGIVLTYASYLRRNDDVVLSGLTASATNEFCEVCLGGMVAIPATFVFLGTAMTLDVINAGSSFGLGFNTLPSVFANMPGGRWFGAMWFFLLFLAAITSSLSMLQPAIAFLEEGFGLKRRVSVAALGLLTAAGSLPVVFFSQNLSVLSVIDDWVGTVGIFVLATIQVILFAWIFGIDRGIEEAHRGAAMRIPGFFKYIIKYVTPAYLLIIFAAWMVNNLPSKIADMRARAEVLATVIAIGVVLFFFGLLIKLAGEQWQRQGRGLREMDE